MASSLRERPEVGPSGGSLHRAFGPPVVALVHSAEPSLGAAEAVGAVAASSASAVGHRCSSLPKGPEQGRVRVLQVRLDEAALIVHEALVALIEEALADHLRPKDFDPTARLRVVAVEIEKVSALHGEDGTSPSTLKSWSPLQCDQSFQALKA